MQPTLKGRSNADLVVIRIFVLMSPRLLVHASLEANSPLFVAVAALGESGDVSGASGAGRSGPGLSWTGCEPAVTVGGGPGSGLPVTVADELPGFVLLLVFVE